MSIIKDLLPIFRKHALTLQEKKKEMGNIYTFTFTTREKMNWKPGQHGIFTVNHTKIKRPTRFFSLISTPEEEKIMISMRIPDNPSDFKRALFDMAIGEVMHMRGPVGSFYMRDTKPTLFIVGGIGITPVNALLKRAMKDGSLMKKKIDIIYIDSSEEFLFKAELDLIKAQGGNLEVQYLTDRNHLMEEVKKYTTINNNQANYFVSGPKSMLNAIKDILKEFGIQNKNIKTDPFIGY